MTVSSSVRLRTGAAIGTTFNDRASGLEVGHVIFATSGRRFGIEDHCCPLDAGRDLYEPNHDKFLG
jgi:hypothetical protein